MTSTPPYFSDSNIFDELEPILDLPSMESTLPNDDSISALLDLTNASMFVPTIPPFSGLLNAENPTNSGPPQEMLRAKPASTNPALTHIDPRKAGRAMIGAPTTDLRATPVSTEPAPEIVRQILREVHAKLFVDEKLPEKFTREWKSNFTKGIPIHEIREAPHLGFNVCKNTECGESNHLMYGVFLTRKELFHKSLSPILQEIGRRNPNLQHGLQSAYERLSLLLSDYSLPSNPSWKSSPVSTLSIRKEQAIAAWPSFMAMKEKEIRNALINPQLNTQSTKNPTLCLFIQQSLFPPRTQIFLWSVGCIINGTVMSIGRLPENSITGGPCVRARILANILDDFDPEALADCSLELGPVEQLQMWKNIKELNDQGKKILPLLQTYERIKASPKKRGEIGEHTGLENSSRGPIARARSSEIRPHLREGVLLEANNKAYKKSSRKGKNGKTSSSHLNRPSLAETEHTPQWLQELLDSAGDDIHFEILKSVMRQLVNQAQKQVDKIETFSDQACAVLPAIPNFSRLNPAEDRPSIIGSLRDYQEASVQKFNRWRASGVNGLICHAPGTGKTRTSCEIMIQMLLENPKQPILVIAPNAVKAQWRREFVAALNETALTAAQNIWNSPEAHPKDRDATSGILGVSIDSQIDRVIDDFLGLTNKSDKELSELRKKMLNLKTTRGLPSSVYMDLVDLEKPLSSDQFLDWCKRFIQNRYNLGLKIIHSCLPAPARVSCDIQADKASLQAIDDLLKLFGSFEEAVSICESSQQLERLLKHPNRTPGILVTEYCHITNGASKESSLLPKTQPSLVIMDEAHKLLEGTKQRRVFTELMGAWKCPKAGLTATPIVNDTQDILKLLNLLNTQPDGESQLKLEWGNSLTAALATCADSLQEQIARTKIGKASNLDWPLFQQRIINASLQCLWVRERLLGSLVDRVIWDDLDNSKGHTRRDIPLDAQPTKEQLELYNKVLDAHGSEFLLRKNLVEALLFHPSLLVSSKDHRVHKLQGVRDSDMSPRKFDDFRSTEGYRQLESWFEKGGLVREHCKGDQPLYLQGKNLAAAVERMANEKWGSKTTVTRITSKDKIPKNAKQNGRGKESLLIITRAQGETFRIRSEEDSQHPAKLIETMSDDQLADFVARSGRLSSQFGLNPIGPSIAEFLAEGHKGVLVTELKVQAEFVHKLAIRRFGLNSDQAFLMHSGMSYRARAKAISDFQKLRGRGIIVILPKSGGAGLDFPGASFILPVYQSWTSKDTEQVEHRIMRGHGVKNVLKFTSVLADEEHSNQTVSRKAVESELMLNRNATAPATLEKTAAQVLQACHAAVRSRLVDTTLPSCTIQGVVQVVADHFEVPPEKLANAYAREPEILEGRQMALYLCRKLNPLITHEKLSKSTTFSGIMRSQLADADLYATTLDIDLEDLERRILSNGPRAQWDDFMEALDADLVRNFELHGEELWTTYLLRKDNANEELSKDLVAPTAATAPTIGSTKRKAEDQPGSLLEEVTITPPQIGPSEAPAKRRRLAHGLNSLTAYYDSSTHNERQIYSIIPLETEAACLYVGYYEMGDSRLQADLSEVRRLIQTGQPIEARSRAETIVSKVQDQDMKGKLREKGFDILLYKMNGEGKLKYVEKKFPTTSVQQTIQIMEHQGRFYLMKRRSRS